MLPVNANATNTIALWPGTLASSWAYRKTLNRQLFKTLLPLMVITFCGSIFGAALLLRTPQTTFLRMVPWLLLGATLLFIFGGRITSWVHRHHFADGPSGAALVAIIFVQLCVAVYIGYFGAGVGFVMLALLTMMGIENIHAMNGMKTLLATCGNGVAIVLFIFKHAVIWPQALLMIGGAALGGYTGAHYAQKLDQKLVRGIVIAIGTFMTAYFFWSTRRL